jgi:hypothetical protein
MSVERTTNFKNIQYKVTELLYSDENQYLVMLYDFSIFL